MLGVRQGTTDDAPTIADFQIRMAKETEGLDLDPDTVRKGVQAVFRNPSKGVYWIAEKASRTLGGLLTVPEWSDWRNGTVLWIHSVYVIPEARRMGVFRALYRGLREQVEGRDDLCGLRLYVDRRNADAHRVYEAVGMNGQHYQLYEWMKHF